jgi:hypothetical protein
MESNLVDDKIEDFYFGQLTRYANAPFFTVNLDRVNELAVKTPPGHIQKQINRLLRTLGGHVEFSGLSSLKPTIEPILNAVSQDEIGRIVLKVRSEQELSNPPCYYDVDVFFVDGIVSFRAYWHVSQRHDMKSFLQAVVVPILSNQLLGSVYLDGDETDTQGWLSGTDVFETIRRIFNLGHRFYSSDDVADTLVEIDASFKGISEKTS